MPHNQHFIQSLIELREHYQALQQTCDRSSSHAIEQLNHINALLVDQLIEEQQFVESLLKLRSHYQSLHDEQQQQGQSARQQLTHLNALLADQLVLQHNQQQSVIEGATVEQKQLNQALAEVINDERLESSQQQREPLEEPEPPETLEQQIPSTSTQANQDFSEPSLLESDLPSSSTPVLGEQHVESEVTIESPSIERLTTSSQRPQQSRSLKTPLLPQYQHLSKSEAVEQLLQENEGSVLHIDYIIRALHGELTPEDIKAEKPRMLDTLRKGVEKGLWDKVPDAVGCYTIDRKLVEPEPDIKEDKDNQPQKQKHTTDSTEQLLPRFREMSFTGAVETVVRDNAGEILTTDITARALYGEIEGKALTQAKAKVGKILWNGAKQGRWQSVPGRLGEYTLSLKDK